MSHTELQVYAQEQIRQIRHDYWMSGSRNSLETYAAPWIARNARTYRIHYDAVWNRKDDYTPMVYAS